MDGRTKKPRETLNDNTSILNGILPLSGITSSSLEDSGGKAFNLLELLKAGFNVPPGFIITSEVYAEFITTNGLGEKITKCLADIDTANKDSIAASASKIKELILSGMIDQGVIDAINEKVISFNNNSLWAVRSSAAAEDMAEASFAGQQDTFLNVKSEDIPQFVKRCWASYWNERAITYRQNAGIERSGMAVVVQSMVNASVSGVMFTRDPVGGNDRIIIESSWGLGESIVSGLVVPDRFVYDKSTSRIVERNISKKTKGIFYSYNGSAATGLDDTKQNSASLDDGQIRALAEAGKNIERHYGTPQDIEWAIQEGSIYILQSRPITTLENDRTLWTRGYGDEYWADVVSPLFFSLLGDYLSKYVLDEGNSIMGYKDLAGKELIKIHKGHIYFNAEVLEGVFTYNPKFSRTKDLLNYFPEKDKARIASAPTKLLRRALAEIRIAVLDPDGTMPLTDKAYKKWAKRFLSEMKPFDMLDLAGLSDEEMHREFVIMENALLKHYRLIRYGMVTHSIGTNLIAKSWLTSWLDDRTGELYARLISGLPNNKTIETNVALEGLAREARADPALLQLLKNTPSADVMARLEGDPKFKKFLSSLEQFLSDYGHRSFTREIFFPRWANDPSLVIDIIKSLAQGKDSNIEDREQQRLNERLETEKLVSKKLGLIKGTIFNIVLNYAQVYLIFRENQRFYLDHQIYRQRRLFMEYGRRFVEKGIIDRQDDIFFLSKEEIFDLAKSGNKGMKGLIRSRRIDFERYRDILPPKFLRGGADFDDPETMDPNARVINGTSASPGLATGRVRIVETISALSSVEDGDILVTQNTDPGWTPVFSRIGALVTETGGILSHGAVVSREYRIPAVTAVRNATHLLRSGQKVRVDGNDGIIYILEE